MRVHHLNCGTHCPLGGALLDGASLGPFGKIVTHCLLIETDQGLVLVDTGYGLQDVAHPHPRLPHLWRWVLNVRFREADTAARQIEALGFVTADVRHIVLTHLDFDHAGGLEDFPNARVHVLASEDEAARARPRSFIGDQRYRPLQWDGVRDWKRYAAGGEPWRGFAAVRGLEGLPPEILLIPLRGHTIGHAGVAIDTGAGWLLHAGDAYLYHRQMHVVHPGCTAGLAIYQAIMDTDRAARRDNQQRLRELKGASPDITIFCSHSTKEFEAMRGTLR